MNKYCDFFYNGECDEYGPILENLPMQELIPFYAELLWQPEEGIDLDDLEDCIVKIRRERNDRMEAEFEPVDPWDEQ